jgi:plastocyanin
VSRPSPRTPWRALASLLLVLASAACGGEDDGADEPARGRDDAGAREDAGAPQDQAEIPMFNGCAADDYEDHSAADDERVIAIAQRGLTYTPKCMIVAAGQRVRWEGNLSAHPLAPGHPEDQLAGSSGNPIAAKASGSVAEFVFEGTGTFPYHCSLHAYGTGQGMAGVVHVR